MSTLMKKAADEEWKKLRKKSGRKTEEKLIEAVSDAAADDATEIYNNNSETLKNLSQKMKRKSRSETTLEDDLKIARVTKIIQEVENLRIQAKRDAKIESKINLIMGADGEDYAI